ncbi:hypothetical protein [Actinocrispum wychmicini]|uniref:Uncharacterized protein n=1 Tax=Actinocrispum wychmicini TaxID=1213861 RepID=A0A4R2JKN2_9PSEU|nr:hypothetical protein [Actinocrispum wychmicini]TCO57129.1 hypothetical protein EV192_106606 [Actinocrispum wychmicini]
MSEQQAHVAAIVHRTTTAGCQAAIVTRVNTDGSVDLVCFGPTGAVPHVRLPEGDEKGAWHWPSGSCP